MCPQNANISCESLNLNLNVILKFSHEKRRNHNLKHLFNDQINISITNKLTSLPTIKTGNENKKAGDCFSYQIIK